MPKLAVSGFDGLAPKVSPTMLGEAQAQTASNVKLYSGELRCWNGPSLDYVPLTAGVRSLYKLENSTLGQSVWLTFASDVDVVPGPVADTSDFRVYYTGAGTPRKTNWVLATTAAPYPSTYREMGVPAPVGAPAVAVSGTAGDEEETRVYVYTYVSTFGTVTEESAPSPASATLDVAEQDVVVSGFSAVPAGNYNITHIRIYRSIAANDELGTYVYVGEIAAGTASFTDNVSVYEVGEELATIGWLPPPSTLTGLVAHPSGALVGFTGNTLYFSEPYYPHAWPLKYAVTVPHPIVGIGVYGQSVVIATDKYPYVATGAYPGSMSVEKVPILEPCLSKPSVASDEYGVSYASPNGLVTIGPSVAAVTTTDLFTRDEWMALEPDELRGVIYNGRYIGMYIDTDRPALVLSREERPALSYLTLDATAAAVDGEQARLFFVNASDNRIYQADNDELRPYHYEWKSKRFVLPQGMTFSTLKLDANYDQLSTDAALNALIEELADENAAVYDPPLLGALNAASYTKYELNGSVLNTLPVAATDRYVQVVVYCDRVAVAVLDMTSFDPVRLPPFRGREIELLIKGNIDVRSIALATTAGELRL